MKQFYYSSEGAQRGPVSEAEILSLIASGELNAATVVWTEGMMDWSPAGTVFPASANSPPPLPDRNAHAPQAPSGDRIGDDFAMRMLLPVGRSGWAIAAGYLGLFAFVIVPAPLALIVSIIAIRDIRKSRSNPRPKHGMGRAVFGLVTGILGTLVLLFVGFQILREG